MPTEPAKRPRRQLPVVGWREWVALPELGVDALRAKVDTGARTAALHAFGLETFERDGDTIARFAVHPDHRRPGPAIVAEARVVDERRITNSGGVTEDRLVIATRIVLGPHRFGTEVTLTRRDELGYPMLLGRQTVRRRFLVDPGRSFLIGHPPAEGET